MKNKLMMLLFILGAVTFSKAQTGLAGGGAKMSFGKPEYDFGKVDQGKTVTHEFTFQNTGKEPLVISSAVGSCGCTVPEYPKDPIAPGKTGVIKVTFNSAGKSGMQDKTVTITSNSTDGQNILHVKGEVLIPKATSTEVIKK